MIIEAARGGHTPVIRCLLDYAPPNSTKNQQAGAKGSASAAKQAQVAKPAAGTPQNQKVEACKGLLLLVFEVEGLDNRYSDTDH